MLWLSEWKRSSLESPHVLHHIHKLLLIFIITAAARTSYEQSYLLLRTSSTYIRNYAVCPSSAMYPHLFSPRDPHMHHLKHCGSSLGNVGRGPFQSKHITIKSIFVNLPQSSRDEDPTEQSLECHSVWMCSFLRSLLTFCSHAVRACESVWERWTIRSSLAYTTRNLQPT